VRVALAVQGTKAPEAAEVGTPCLCLTDVAALLAEEGGRKDRALHRTIWRADKNADVFKGVRPQKTETSFVWYASTNSVGAYLQTLNPEVLQRPSVAALLQEVKDSLARPPSPVSVLDGVGVGVGVGEGEGGFPPSPDEGLDNELYSDELDSVLDLLDKAVAQGMSAASKGAWFGEIAAALGLGVEPAPPRPPAPPPPPPPPVVSYSESEPGSESEPDDPLMAPAHLAAKEHMELLALAMRYRKLGCIRAEGQKWIIDSMVSSVGPLDESGEIVRIPPNHTSCKPTIVGFIAPRDVTAPPSEATLQSIHAELLAKARVVGEYKTHDVMRRLKARELLFALTGGQWVIFYRSEEDA
jgi:hypothetical protein